MTEGYAYRGGVGRPMPEFAWRAVCVTTYPDGRERRIVCGPYWAKGPATAAANRERKWMEQDNSVNQRWAKSAGLEFVPITFAADIQQAELHWGDHS